MAGTLKLTFDSSVSTFGVGDSLTIPIDVGGAVYQLTETWVNLRTQKWETSIVDQGAGVDIASDAALSYGQAWDIDYRLFGDQIIPASVNILDANTAEVTLVIDYPGWIFGNPTGSLIDDGKVTFELTGNVFGVPESISGTVAKNDGDPCGFVDFDLVITGDTGVYDIVTSEGTYLGVSSPYTVTFIRRAVHQVIQVTGVNRNLGTIEVDLPRKINASDISIGLTYGLSGGATVAVIVGYTNAHITPYQYSLDGITYQSGSTFSSVAVGSYTVYVKDSFDCVTTKDFLIDGVTALTDLVFNVSEVNPIRFVKNRAGADKKNIINSLSCEELKQMPYRGVHAYPSSSDLTIQMQTNAPYIRVYAEDNLGNETTVAHNKSVQNTGLTGYTTASLFSVNGRATLYWGYVDTLDPLTDDVIGNTNFGSFIPTWADDAGKVVNVETLGDVLISKIYYDAVRQSSVAELDVSYGGAESTVRVRGVYNEQPYDVYEFVINISALYSEFRIKIDYGIDINNLELGWTSEDITTIVDSDEYIRLDYWDEDNRGNFIYQTGIQHHIYLRAAMDYVGEQSTEGYNGDTEFYKINDEIYFSFNLIAEFLPSAFAHKLRVICAHRFLYINGLKCKLAEAPEIEGELATNLKTFTALVKVSGNDFLPMDLQNVLSEADNLSGALEAIQGKANLLWTKING